MVFLRGFFFDFVGFGDQTPIWIKVISYLLFIFPAYQVLILFFGFLFGQFGFFWDKEKRMIKAIKRVVISKQISGPDKDAG